MIVKMKQLTLFVQESRRHDTLKALRCLGAVHLKTLKQQQSPDLTLIITQIDSTERAIDVLRQYKHTVDKRNINRAITDTHKKIENVPHGS